MHVKKSVASIVTKSAIIGMATAGLLSATASTASAISPDVEISNVQPVESGELHVARIAPFSSGSAPRWRVRAKVTVTNKEDKTIRLTKFYIGYQGPGSVSADVKDTNEDPNIDSRDIAPDKTLVVNIEDGMARSDGKGINRSLFFPLPSSAQINLKFDGFLDTKIFTRDLGMYANKTPQGSYPFPGKAKDLKVGEHWSAGIHAFGASQEFGYDFNVRRWDSVNKLWTALKLKTDGSGSEDGSKNSHHLIWGKPVYAMAAGTIVRCAWSEPDNSKPGVKDGGLLNGFTIDHGKGEIAQYAHLQAGTVNESLCPKNVAESTYGLTIPVAAGQFLGKVGNSGNSTGPHLHVHVSRGVGGKLGTGVPLLFHGIRNVGDKGDKTTIGPGPFSYNVSNTGLGQMPAAPFNLIQPL